MRTHSLSKGDDAGVDQKLDAIKLFLIRKPDGRRFISKLGPVGEESSLCEVLVVERDGVGEVHILSTREKISPFDLRGRTVEEVAKTLLEDEERAYGKARRTG